jgi:superfamily I DNA/RNA helicase
MRLLREAGRRVDVDAPAVDTCYARAWSAVRRDSPLAALGVAPGYWREEISHVIKGRGITDPDAYAALRRLGRVTALGAAQRAAVWQLYQEYERLRVERGLVDWDDVLLLAHQAVVDGAVATPWNAVIVDEVQDLTGAGLRLLHRLVGDRTDGLLLVGDGQQSLYPGGASLAETGISVVGRSAVLDVNYRNSAAVLREALTLVGADPFDDLDDSGDPPRRMPDGGVEVIRRGGSVIRAEAADDISQRLALLAHLTDLHHDGVRYGDVALLVPTNAAAGRWMRHLTAAGVPATALSQYSGVRDESVKVGTFERAKALEFAHVLIPDSDQMPGKRRPTESDETYAERTARERRRLYVGYTRPRDGLWLGATTARPPSN